MSITTLESSWSSWPTWPIRPSSCSWEYPSNAYLWHEVPGSTWKVKSPQLCSWALQVLVASVNVPEGSLTLWSRSWSWGLGSHHKCTGRSDHCHPDHNHPHHTHDDGHTLNLERQQPCVLSFLEVWRRLLESQTSPTHPSEDHHGHHDDDGDDHEDHDHVNHDAGDHGAYDDGDIHAHVEVLNLRTNTCKW